MVAQQQRHWEEAEQYYQQALQIYIEYQDRYAQANTYQSLGIIAREQQQWLQSREYLLLALKLYVDYNSSYDVNNTLYSLALLWPASNDTELTGAVAGVLGWSVEETEALLRKMLE